MRLGALALLPWLSLMAAERFDFVEPHMGTLFRISIYSDDAESAASGARAAFARIRDLDNTLSDYKADSELMRLGVEPVKVSRDLFRVLEASQALARETEGAFDVTQGAVIRLWRAARVSHQLPGAKSIQEARRRSGYGNLLLDAVHQTVSLKVAGLQVDLGGIAKGYAADEALLVLRKHGLPAALVAASGDLAIGDAPPGRDGWNVKISAGQVLSLRNVGVSTSGDDAQFLDVGGKRYSHIIDPRTGWALNHRISATVIARDGMTADSLATAVSVLGPGPRIELIERRPGAAVLILAEGAVIKSTRWPECGAARTCN